MTDTHMYLYAYFICIYMRVLRHKQSNHLFHLQRRLINYYHKQSMCA